MSANKAIIYSVRVPLGEPVWKAFLWRAMEESYGVSESELRREIELCVRERAEQERAALEREAAR